MLDRRLKEKDAAIWQLFLQGDFIIQQELGHISDTSSKVCKR